MPPTEKKNDIENQQPHFNVAPCRKSKLCPQIETAKIITYDKLNITEKVKGTGSCKKREIIYTAQCSKHKVLYIRHTGEQLAEHLPKHHYNIKNRPENSELAKQFRENHNFKDDANVTILQSNIKTAFARRYHENK